MMGGTILLLVLLVVICIAKAAQNESTIVTWTEIPGGLKHISTSINYNWGVDSTDKVYICTRPCTGQWKLVAGSFRQLDVNDMEIWAVNKYNHIYKRSVDGSGSWIRVSGLLKHVSASGNGYIWGVKINNDIFKCKKPCSGGWVSIPGKFKQIDGGEKFVFGVDSKNQVFRRLVDGSASWIHISTKKMKYVSVGVDHVYGVEASTSHVYQCALPCAEGHWVVAESCFRIKQVEAAVDELISITPAGTIFKRVI